MTPKFAQAIDPVFLHVFDLLDRIAANERISPEQERLKLHGRLDVMEGAIEVKADAELARYAITCWIDETLCLDVEWRNREWWQSNTLEWERFNTMDRHERFYLRAREASGLRQKDALEVFYVCVVLGFRGLYRDPARAADLAQQYQLPPELDTWIQQTGELIRLGQGQPPISREMAPIEGAAPLDGALSLLWAALAALVLATVNGLAIFYFWTRTP